MLYRTFGRTGWQVSEIGYGMWGRGGWTESEDAESLRSLQLAVDPGDNFVPENLHASVDRAARLRPLVPENMTMPEMALRWILANPVVSTIIPGMRRERNVRANVGVSDGFFLDESLMQKLREHRWGRTRT